MAFCNNEGTYKSGQVGSLGGKKNVENFVIWKILFSTCVKSRLFRFVYVQVQYYSYNWVENLLTDVIDLVPAHDRVPIEREEFLKYFFA